MMSLEDARRWAENIKKTSTTSAKLDLSNPPRGGSYSRLIPSTCVPTESAKNLPESWRVPMRISMTRDGKVVCEYELPPYGETRIVTHDGRVTFIETTVKEKVE